MVKIKIEPEVLEKVSTQFKQAHQHFNEINKGLVRDIASLQSQWQGIERENFFQRFSQSQHYMKEFEMNLVNVSKDLQGTAMTFRAADTVESAHRIWEFAGKVSITAGSGLGALLVATKQIKIERSKKNASRAVIHAAKWMKGQGDNKVMKGLARQINASFKNPGLTMKFLKGADKYTGGKLLNINRAKDFSHWMRSQIVGIDDYGIRSKKIPGAIAKRVFPIQVVYTLVGEGLTMAQLKAQNGRLTKEDWAVFVSNNTIKIGSAYGGAILGGTMGLAIGGPPGAAIGALIGGAVGTWVGDPIAKVAEGAIRNGVEGAKKSIKEKAEKIENFAKKGFKWAKGIFK